MSSGNHLTRNNTKDFALGVLSLLSPALFLATPSLVLYINTHHPPGTLAFSHHQPVIPSPRFYSYSTFFSWLLLLILQNVIGNVFSPEKPSWATQGSFCCSILILSLTKYYLLGLFPSVSILATLQLGIYLISQSSAW